MKRTRKKPLVKLKTSSLKRDLLSPKYRMRVVEDKKRKQELDYDWKKDEC